MSVKYVRPTIRLDEKFNDELKLMMIRKKTNFQTLTSKLLENWYIDQLCNGDVEEEEEEATDVE